MIISYQPPACQYSCFQVYSYFIKPATNKPMTPKSTAWFDKPTFKSLPTFAIEPLLINLIILLAVAFHLAGLDDPKALMHPLSETYG